MPVIADPENPQPANQSTSLMLDNFADGGFVLDDLVSLADAGRSQSDIGTINIAHRMTMTMQASSGTNPFALAENIATSDTANADPADMRVPCDFCGRKFNPDAL